MKRCLDLALAAPLLFALALPMLIIGVLIRSTSRGPAIHWSKRVGKNNRPFWMPKFRTMRLETPQLATHLLLDSQHWMTPLGNWLRKASLDELPQLWSILCGQMSFVGPRPALFNQDDLVELRTAAQVHTLLPGLTGWAQVNGRDEVSISDKVELDKHYFAHRSLALDIYILLMTVVKVCRREGVRQADEVVEREVSTERRAA